LVAVALFFAVVTTGLDRWQDFRFDQRLAAAQQSAEIAARLKQAVGEIADSADRGSLPPEWTKTEILGALTEALPDSVWLDRIHVEAGTVDISGFATEAANLVPLLEDTKTFQDVHFVGPVVRDPEKQKEQFQISMTLRDVE